MQGTRNYEIGDYIKIRSWEDMEEEFGKTSYENINCKFAFIKEMKPLCGLMAEITAFDVSTEHVHLQFINALNGIDTHWTYSFDMIEPISKEDKEGALYDSLI